MLRKPRIFLTGAFGYLGLALLTKLASDHEIVAFGHAPRNPAAKSVIPASVTVVEGDLADVGGAIQSHGSHAPFQAVIHLAGGGGPHKCAADPIAAIRANIRGTSGLLEAARSAGVPRLIYASTIAVYGTERVPTGPYRESDQALPDDIYGVIKEAAEHVWTAIGGGTALRIANIYGSGSGVDLGVLGAVERFARAAAIGGQARIFGTGDQRIDYVHVDDVTLAFRRAIEAPGLPPAINVGGGAPISIAELWSLCQRAGESLGARPTLERQPAPPGKSWPDRSLAIDLAAQVLGWRPQIGYEQGLTELVTMMRQAEAIQ